MAQSPQMNRGIVKQVILIVYVIIRLVKPFDVVYSLWNATFYIGKSRVTAFKVNLIYTIKSINLSYFCFHTGSFRR